MQRSGRPSLIDLRDIERAGCELGLRDLSVKAVATRLGVTPTALYRHIDGRWGLERLVGERILADLALNDDPSNGTVPHLLHIALQLRAYALTHPGLAAYLQILFPRGEGGARLLASAAASLERRGYSAEAAMVLCTAVATVTIGFAAAEEARHAHVDELSEERRRAEHTLVTDAHLGEPYRRLPDIDDDEYVRMWLGAAIQGFVAAAPPGREPADIRQALHAAGKGH